MDAQVIRILVEANSAGVATGLAPGLASLTAFEAKATSSVGKLKTAFDGVSTSTKVLAGAAVGIGLLATAIGSTIGPAIEFESAFAGVRKTVDGTEEQLGSIRTGLLEMSKVMPVAASDLAGIAESAGQLGIATPDVLEFTRTIAMLAETTDLDFDQAATQLAQFLNITGSGAQTVEQLGDTIVELGNNSATTESKILNFAQRLAGAGALAGYQDAEILGLAAAFSSLGIEAEAGGTSVSRLIKQIEIADGTKLQQFADVAGMTAEEFANLRDNDPAAALASFVEGLGRIKDEGGDVVTTLDELGFTGERVQNALLLAAAGADTVVGSLDMANAAYNEGGALAEEYGKRVETTAAKIEIFKNQLNVLAIEIGSNFLGAVREGVAVLSDFVQFMATTFGPALSEIVDFLAGVATGFGTVIGVVGSPVLATAGVALTTVAVGLEAIFAALNALAPLAPILGGIAAGIGVLVTSSSLAAGSLTLLGGSAGVAATAMAALPWVAVAAGAALVATSFQDARQYAEGFREELEELRTNDQGFTSMEGLLDVLNETNSVIGETGLQVDSLGEKWNALAGMLPGVADDTRNAALELKIAGETATQAEKDFVTIRDTLQTVGSQFGLTAIEVQRIAIAAGIDPGGLLDPSTWNAVTGEIFFAVEAYASASSELQNLTDNIGSGTQTVEDYATVLGRTAEEMVYLAQLADVDLMILEGSDAEAANEVWQALQLVNLEMEILSSNAPITTSEFIAQRSQADELTGSLSALDDALARVNDRQAALQQALAGTETHLLEFNAAIEEQDIEYAAQAMGEYLKALASTGDIDGAIAAQDEMRGIIQQLGADMDLSEAAVGRLLVKYGLLSEAEIVELGIAGQELIDEALESVNLLQYGLDELTARAYIAEISADMGLAEDVFARAFAAGEDWALEVWQAELDADNDPALQSFQNAADAGEAWAILYLAELDAQDNSAQTILDAAARGDAWAVDYLASLSVEDRATLEILAAQGAGDTYDGSVFEAEVDVVDNATNTISNIINAMAGITDKAVTVSVNGQGPGTSGFGAPVSTGGSSGGSTGGGGPLRLADGGLVEHYARGGVRERHVAQIAPAGAMRVWAEPETGGEAYIPLAHSKRPRSMAIWRETGRRLGVKNFANGGFDGLPNVQYFNSGGITTDTFATASGIPGVVVNVAVDARALGQVNVDLGPVVGVIGEIDRGLGDIGAAYGQFGQDADRITRAITLSSGAFADQFRNEIPEAMRFSVASTGELVDAFERAGTGIHQSISLIGQSILSELDMSDFIDVMVNDFGFARDQFTAHIEEMGYSVSEAVDAMAGSGIDLQYVWEAVFLDAASASEVFEVALLDVERAVDDVDAAMRRAEAGFDLITGSTFDAVDAQFDYLDAVDRVKEAIADGEVFGIVSEEARRNETDLRRAGEAMQEYGIEIAGSGVSAQDAVTRFRALEQEFIALAIASGKSAVEAEELAAQLFGIPDSVIAEIAVLGLEEKEEIEKVTEALEILDAKTAIPTIDGDSDPFGTVAAAVEATLQSLDVARAEAELDADSSDFDAALTAVNGDLAVLDAAIAVAGLDGDETEFNKAAEAVRTSLGQIEAMVADPDFTADKSAFDKIAAAVDQALDALNATVADPDVTLTDNASGPIGEVASKLSAINATTAVPTLKINDQATGTVSGLQSRLLGLAKSYTATVTTRLVTDDRRADGISNVPILVQGNSLGGFNPGDIPNGHAPEFADASSRMWRLWKEPETGGESFIPHANDHRRPGAMGVLQRTATLFGARVVPMALGGMSGRDMGPGGIYVAPGAVQLEISGANASPEQLGRIAEQAVTRALDKTLRDLNRDIGRR